MPLSLQITFRQMEPSPAVEARVRELAERLDKFSDRIMSCQVVIEAPHHHQRQGKLYEVHIELTTPGSEVVASRQHSERQSHEDVYVALRDAFRAVRRQLTDHQHLRRHGVTHPEEAGE